MKETEDSRAGLSTASAAGLLTSLTAVGLYTLLDLALESTTAVTGHSLELPASVAAIVLVCAVFAGVVAFVATLAPSTSSRSVPTDGAE